MIENTVNVAQAAATVSVIASTTRAEIERIFNIVRPQSGRKASRRPTKTEKVNGA
jgi:hypothetical protein